MKRSAVASILLVPLGGCLCFTGVHHPALPIPTARPPKDSRFGRVPVTKQRLQRSPFRTISRRPAAARDVDDVKPPPSHFESIVANAKDIFNFGRNMKFSNQKYLTAVTAGLA